MAVRAARAARWDASRASLGETKPPSAAWRTQLSWLTEKAIVSRLLGIKREAYRCCCANDLPCPCQARLPPRRQIGFSQGMQQARSPPHPSRQPENGPMGARAQDEGKGPWDVKIGLAFG